MIISERLSALREAMKKDNIAAYIIPGTDPHASEYIAEHWKEREWISGFTGSAGTVVVTLTAAGLWTDSRYFLQAETQLAGTSIDLFKDGLLNTPSINQWLVSVLRKGDTIAVNPEMFSTNNYDYMANYFNEMGIKLESKDLLKNIWSETRPQLPLQPFFVLDTKYAGQSVAEKLALVRAEMAKQKADLFVISALDEIAWLLNIRGTDVNYNPVIISYVIVENDNCTLFIAPEKLTPDTIKYLIANNISISDYENVYSALRETKIGTTILYDGAKLNRALYEAIPCVCRKTDTQSPVLWLKSIKNATEIDGIRQAMLADGVALTRFFMWLEKEVKTEKLSEYDVMIRLKEFRATNKLFVGESFSTIAGYNANGAIVHYCADANDCATLMPCGMLLLDSGGQYFNGTTDITRTISFDEPTAEQKHDFTLVLKGHIALAKAIFPRGTRGSQLDILARHAMWNEKINYGHGTGHGVGHFLSVHEGPQNIRMSENPTILEVGMIISDEPGIYRTGKYGIRTENLVCVTNAEESEFGQFLQFETLTLCPYDQKLIDCTMLTQAEIDWINAYHRRVYNSISPMLNDKEKRWLAEQTKVLNS